MARFLWLMNTAGGPPPFLGELSEHRFDAIPQYDLARADLAAYAAIVAGMHTDQRHLCEESARLKGYIEDGGALVFSGHVAHPFLPWLRPFRPAPQKGLESLRIHLEAAHPLTEGLNSDHLTFQRGVAGFYGRGSNPPPEDALVLTSVGDERMPVDWLAKRGKGRLLVHCGNDLFAHWRRAEPASNRFLHQFFGFFGGKA